MTFNRYGIDGYRAKCSKTLANTIDDVFGVDFPITDGTEVLCNGLLQARIRQWCSRERLVVALVGSGSVFFVSNLRLCFYDSDYDDLPAESVLFKVDKDWFELGRTTIEDVNTLLDAMCESACILFKVKGFSPYSHKKGVSNE